MRRVLTILAVWLVVVQSATNGRGFTSATKAACGFAVHAQNSLEERLFSDAADGRLDEFSPLGAALVAGGVDNADVLRRYEQKAKSLADQLRRSVKGDSPIFAETKIGTVPTRQQVEVVFDFMHRRVLHGGYDLAASDLRIALDEGRFNCVSATVLFNYFAGEVGLKCRGLEMPSHAMSRVLLPEGAIDVETTCPRWFHLADHPRQQTADLWCGRPGCPKSLDAPAESPSRRDACTTIARSRKGNSPICAETKIGAVPREVSPIQLAAMIYYNRGVDLLAEKRFAEAAAANAESLRLDPNNATARGNLLATINNWSIQLGDSRHFAEAVDLLRRGLAIDPKFDAFAQNYVHVHHQWVEQLCREGHFEEALTIVSRATAEMPDRPYLQRAESEVRQRWAKSAAAASPDGPLLSWPCVKCVKTVD